MLKKLRLRLTLLCVLMTGTVLVVLMLTMLFLTERQAARQNELLFENNLATLVNRLQSKDLINTDWLAETEAFQRCVIALENNGMPLRFSGAWTPPTDRSGLVRQVRAQARKMGVDYQAPPLDITKPTQTAFLHTGADNHPYRCAVVTIPTDQSWLSLTVAFDNLNEQQYLRQQRILYLLLFFAAFAVLWLLSWWFTGKAIRPTAQSIERQREFVAAASHELRAPLTVIQATASAIRIEPSLQEKLTCGIESECARMGRLVSDLLLLANTDTAAWQLQLAPVELDCVLIETVELFEQPARQRGFSLSLELPDEMLPRVNSDGQRLRQLLSILLQNAVSHAGSGGALLVAAKRYRHTVCISVIDHGKGIPAEARERVFDRFFQLDAAHTDKAHFGLGLSVAKELARLHNGTLALSETAGGGCTFQLQLPIA